MSLKNFVRSVSPVAAGIHSYQKGRRRDKANKKELKKQQEMAESKEGSAYRLSKQATKQQRHVIQGKEAVPTDIKELTQQFGQAYEGADKLGKDFERQQISQFQQQTAPQILTNLGHGFKGSSAMNQALAASIGNLQENIASNLSNLKFNQASQVFGQSQAGRAQNIANASAASQGALNQPSAYQPYMGGPSNTSSFINKWAPVAGGVIGGVAMGPGGIVPGMQAGTAIGQVAT